MKNIIALIALCLLAACSRNLTPEQQALRLQKAQFLMQASSIMTNQGMMMTTPAVNRYYSPPGTVIVPRYGY